MLRSWVGGLGRHDGEIFAEFEPEPFSGQVLIGAGLVLHNGAQTFEMVAEREVVRAEPKGVGKSNAVRAGAAKGLRAHLPAYLDEMCFRFNNRKNEFLFRDTMLKLIGSPNLEYKHLTEKVQDAA